MNGHPFIAHVHVPKTAGTAIDGALQTALGPGRHHVEGIIEENATFVGVVNNSNWISGHVPEPKLRAEIAKVGRKAHFVTALREPFAHVASHYNWLIEIGHRGDAFLHGHPPAIIEIHERIKTSDNTDPDVIIRNLHMNPRLFLNCQSMYVLGTGAPSTVASLSASLDRYDGLVFSDDIKGGLSAAIPNIEFDPKEKNASPYHFDRDIFGDPKLVRYLEEKNASDLALWNFANDNYRERNGVT